MRSVLAIGLLILVLAACGREGTAVLPTSQPSPTQFVVEAGPTLEDRPKSAPTVVPTSLPTATAVPSPEPTPAPISVRLSVGPGVPLELEMALRNLAATDPAHFVWLNEGGDVQLEVNGQTAVADWIYAVAVPFHTFQDDLTFQALQESWQTGDLLLDPETENVLRALWGETAGQITPVSPDQLVDRLWSLQTGYDTAVITILPFDRLEPRLKVLRLEGTAPIDMDFNPASYALTIPFGLSGDAEAVAAVLAAWEGPLTNRDDGRVTHVVMTGPAGMRRAVADRMDRYGIQYPGEETGPVLHAADIAHMSNENAFALDCPPADPLDSENVCNRVEYFELMTWMGIDVNEMTGNHLNDWGLAAMLYTIELYEANGIRIFGGGRNLEEASQPLLLEHNGNKIAFVGCNPVGPEYGWATADAPGSLPCGDYSDLQAQIAQLAEERYLVIATLQYLEDYQYAVLEEQRQVFQALAAAGATAVSGSHAHHPQGFSFYEGAFIHYGLGNLLADQMWSLGSRQTFLDVYTFYKGRLLNVDLWTGLNEDYARIRQMTPEERRELLGAVFAESDW